MSRRPLCIFHSPCQDGFAAAWAVRKALAGEVDFFPGVYQTDPPDVADRDVIIVDFSYKRLVLMEMAAVARSILVLDHHESAAEDLRDLPRPAKGGWEEHLADVKGAKAPIRAWFNMNNSGAMMAWQYFHPGKAPPHLLEHIQDRDLGGGIAHPSQLPGTREITAALFSYPYDFASWDLLMDMPIERLRQDGVAITRRHQKDIAELIEASQMRMTIGGHNVPVANLPYTYASDAAHAMAEGEPFAATYYRSKRGWEFSLRSAPGGVNVREIAERYSGGGHPQAAGFRVISLDMFI